MLTVTLFPASLPDSEELYTMQIAAFRPLLDKYQDFSTNPAAEPLDKIKWRMGVPEIDHYFIMLGTVKIGSIRIRRLDENRFRLNQMFILPEFQGNGCAQQAIALSESLYPQAVGWELDTIKQEPKLRYLYEKMGYRLTGEERGIKDGMDLVYYAK